MQSFRIVDLLDKHRQAGGCCGKGLVIGSVDFFDLQGLHEALCLCVVIGITDAAHRAAQACSLKGITVVLRGVLAAAVGMMDAALGRVPSHESRANGGGRQFRVQVLRDNA